MKNFLLKFLILCFLVCSILFVLSACGKKDNEHSQSAIKNDSVNYYVEYYLQNIDDDNYILKDRIEKNATENELVTAEILNYEHFTHVIISDSIESVSLNKTSVTILKVYYSRNKYSIYIQSQSDDIILSSIYNDEVKYGTVIPEITVSSIELGYDACWYNSNDMLISKNILPSFTVDKDIYYYAYYDIKQEMQNFDFISTVSTCEIVGVKDKTVSEIVVPDYVTHIQEGALNGCSFLESLTIPFVGDSKKTVEDTLQYPFGYIFGTDSFDNGIETQQYYYGDSFDSTISSVYFIPCSLKNVIISGGNILRGAFYNCENIEYVFIPDNIIKIEEDAFRNCSKLKNIRLPNSIMYFGYDVFMGCSNLQYYFYDNGLYLGNENNNYLVLVSSISLDIDSCLIHNDTKVIFHAFYNCSQLTNIVIPNSVLVIEWNSFSECIGLQSVIIGENVKFIGNWAFNNCKSLNEIIIPSTVESIGYRAFQNCVNLNSITICNGVESIKGEAFYGCKNLTSINIPDSVINIGLGAIGGCYSLKNITIPFVGGSKDAVVSSQTTLFGYIFGTNPYNGSSAVTQFYADDSPVTYYIPDSLRSVTIIDGGILFGCFYGCQKLASITLPNNLQYIGQGAFRRCYSLTEIVIPNEVKTIAKNAFYDCNSLTIAILSNSLQEIGNDSFHNCSKLKSILISDGIEEIGDNAFFGCGELTKVYYKGDVNEWTNILMGDNNSNLTNATLYYYSEIIPFENGNFWHYDTDNITPIIWVENS